MQRPRRRKTAAFRPLGGPEPRRGNLMGVGAVLRALLAKNWALKRRHPVATWSEVVNPLLCILLFALLKRLDTDLEIPAGWATAAANASDPELGTSWDLFALTDFMAELNATLESAGMSSDNILAADSPSSSSSSGSISSTALLLQLSTALRLPKFYFTESTMPGLLVSLGLQSFLEADRLDELSSDDLLVCALKFVLLGYTGPVGTSTFAVPVECRGRVVPYRLAITPDNSFTRDYFSASMEQWHPRLPLAPSVYGISLLTAPSFTNSRLFFDNESALEAYMTSEEYGTSSTKPKIYAAITFDEFPSDDSIGDTRGHPIAYSLRLNATRARSGFPSCVPHTRHDSALASASDKALDTSATLSYATRGFMTLQTAIARFLNCMPEWDSTAKTTNGECQIAEAVSNASIERDEQLLEQLAKDMVLSSAFDIINSMKRILPESLVGGNISELSNDVSIATIPDASKEQLLVTLRMAPQAHLGGAVFVAPTPAFRYTPFYDKVRIVFPVGFVLSYLYTVSRMVVAFLTEKETRSRELLRIFGTSDAMLFTSWLLTYIILLVAATALQTAGARALLFPNSDAGLLFAFFFTFALSSFSFAFLVSAFFSRARSGSFVGMATFFMIFFVSYSFGDDTGEDQRTWGSLLSPVALAQGIDTLARLEAVSVGVTKENAHELSSGFRFQTAIYMQLLDFLLYIIIAAYAQMVVPQEFGVPEKWYFILSPTYWRRQSWHCCPSQTVTSPTLLSSKIADKGEVAVDDHSGYIEQVGEDLSRQEQDSRAIVIKRLTKTFAAQGGGVRIAVNKLSLSLYEGHVTCLLGHNGAGKSTLISMLTGMTAPTEGEAWIRGLSISTSMERVRESLGYCPQTSVLYPELTVEEHLRLYGRIKGIKTFSELTNEVNAKITEVGLQAKRQTRADALSGGMQRRLSLAIAFLGDSQVVFLDEPTSGMDPYSRRSTWDLIRSNRKGRVVVLTTHFMDEADVLGDCIAILAEGTLRCVGSPLFLKNHFGVGYRLSITRGDQNQGEERGLVRIVRAHVPLADVISGIGTELMIQLPFESTAGFPALFRALDKEQSTLGITSYAISVTTLEEVFLKVLQPEHLSNNSTSNNAEDDKEHSGAQVVVTVTTNSNPMTVKTSEMGEAMSVTQPDACRGQYRILQQQFIALVRKRMLYGKRDRNMLLFRTLLPIVVIFAGLAALRQSLFLKNDPKKQLDTASEYPLGIGTPIPMSFPGESLAVSSFADVIDFFSGGEVFEVPIPNEVYDALSTPVVFGVSYNSPEFAYNDTSGYCLRFGELAFENGYGVAAPYTTEINGELGGLSPNERVTEGQFGGYVVYGDNDNNIRSYNLLVNSTSTHSPPIYKTMLDGAIHRSTLTLHAANAGNPLSQAEIERIAIRVASHPLPLSFKTRSLFTSFLSLPAVIFVVIAFTFIPASVMPFLVREKQDGQNAKYQQLLSGVSLPAYWLANFIYDMALYLVPMAAAIILLRSFGVSSSLSKSNGACATCTQDVSSAVVALFILFGTSMAPWTYLLSHFMADPRACLLYTIMINFVLGIILILISYTMSTMNSTRAANDALVFLWRLSPLFSLGNGLLSVIVADIKALYGLTGGEQVSAFDTNIAGTEIIYLALEGPLYFFLAVAVDEYTNRSARHDSHFVGNLLSMLRCKFSGAKKQTQSGSIDPMTVNDGDDEDEDITAETLRVGRRIEDNGAESTAPLHAEPVKVVGLRKRYPNGKLAVKNLTFGLGAGECFGFLGINGAGKTTTMRILTGDLTPSAGSAYLNGYNILTQRRDARRSIGYCPQFDALLDLLSVREHLELYGRLKGLGTSKRGLEQEIQRLIHVLHLVPFENKLAGALSGGNKRKLSVAIAMLGQPKVIFLDEPSTGMDPGSRRKLWDVILDVSARSKKSTVVLTTHSMDECEALCNRAGIMVDGRLQCLGTIPHLKARFGDGFLLDCKIQAAMSQDIHSMQEDLVGRFGLELDSSRLNEVCEGLGNANRGAIFIKSLPGSSGTNGNERVTMQHLCAWWLMEERAEALDKFLQLQFGSTSNSEVVLLERQGGYCRYRIATANVSLGDLFEIVESAKGTLHIQEYSASHTSLEQIFNSFASRQEAPTAAGNPSSDKHR